MATGMWHCSNQCVSAMILIGSSASLDNCAERSSAYDVSRYAAVSCSFCWRVDWFSKRTNFNWSLFRRWWERGHPNTAKSWESLIVTVFLNFGIQTLIGLYLFWGSLAYIYFWNGLRFLSADATFLCHGRALSRGTHGRYNRAMRVKHFNAPQPVFQSRGFL